MDNVRGFKYYSLSGKEKNKVINLIKEVLSKEKHVLLAIIFGSFIELSSFRDIDIAVYSLNTTLNYLAELAVKIEEKVKIPIDIVPISELSTKFKQYVLTKGLVIFERTPGLYEALLSQVADELMLMEKSR